MYKPGTRPFIFTRDMFAGTQRWAALWTGDNVSNWEHLAMSIPMQHECRDVRSNIRGE